MIGSIANLASLNWPKPTGVYSGSWAALPFVADDPRAGRLGASVAVSSAQAGEICHDGPTMSQDAGGGRTPSLPLDKNVLWMFPISSVSCQASQFVVRAPLGVSNELMVISEAVSGNPVYQSLFQRA